MPLARSHLAKGTECQGRYQTGVINITDISNVTTLGNPDVAMLSGEMRSACWGEEVRDTTPSWQLSRRHLTFRKNARFCGKSYGGFYSALEVGANLEQIIIYPYMCR